MQDTTKGIVQRGKLLRIFTSAVLGLFATTARAGTNITENLTLTADLDLRDQGTVTIDDASVARGYRVKACAGGLRIYRGLAIFVR